MAQKAFKVLVVDDDHEICTLLEYRLRHEGYQVFLAHDGLEGLGEVKRIRPDLIILDLMMPKLSGEALCRKVKEDRDETIANIPIVMLTAKASNLDRTLGKALGADAYITKPIDQSRFLDEVKRLLPHQAAVKREMIRVLLIEDNDRDAETFETLLSQDRRYSYQVDRKRKLIEGLEALQRGRIGLMVVDLNLPDSDEVNTLRTLSERVQNVPLIVLSDESRGTLGAEILRLGIQEVLDKKDLERGFLLRTISYAMERNRLVQEMHRLSLVDELTGLYNRRGFLTLVELQLKISLRDKKNLAVVFIDVDALKQINDSFGHQEGDAVLKGAARILRQTFRDSDIIARIGGDEFAVAAITTHREDSEVLIRRLDEKLREEQAKQTKSYRFSLSSGAVCHDRSRYATIEEALVEADRLMYERKRKSRSAQ